MIALSFARHFEERNGMNVAHKSFGVIFGLLFCFSLSMPALAASTETKQLELYQCIEASIPKFDDGQASPEEIVLAARHLCSSQEFALLDALATEFDDEFPDGDSSIKRDFVSTMLDTVIQQSTEFVAATVLSKRVSALVPESTQER